MSLTLALQTARSGLSANAASASATSNNIANATTEGYARRDPTSTSLVLGGVGQGVDLQVVRSGADAQLLRNIRFGLADEARSEAQATALTRYTEVIGQPQDERSLASALGELREAFQTAADNPSSQSGLRGVRDAAQALVDRLGATEQAIRTEREQADRAIGNSVAAVNDSLSRIEALNRDIAVFSAAGRETGDLLDERDRQLDRLAAELPIRTFEREDGAVVVMTRGGTTLLDGTASTVSFSRVDAIPPGLSYPADAPPLSGLTVDGQDIAPGGGSGSAIDGGRIAGLFELRDSILPDFQRQTDELAARIADAFEASDATVPGGGVTGLFVDSAAPGAEVDPAAMTPGLAGRLSLNPLADPSQGGDVSRIRDGLHAAPPGPVGDPTQLFAHLDAFSAQQAFDPALGLGSNLTLEAFASASGAAQQTARADAERDTTAAGLSLETLQTARQNETGVNVDAEMQRLLEIQNSYAASAQVIQTVARMLDELLTIA